MSNPAITPVAHPPGSPASSIPLRSIAPELIASLAAIAAITGGYLYLARNGIPAASSGTGYAFGILGFLMMLGTETLYSLRKRRPGFHYGAMSTWLQLHIFTGLVGPYLVLLHSGWKFNGLAGVLMLVTVVVVVSGLIGRYIYTAVPRSLDGVELAIVDVEEKIADADRQLETLGVDRSSGLTAAVAAPPPHRGWVLVLARPLLRWRQRRRLRHLLHTAGDAVRPHLRQIEALLDQRHRLLMQIQSMETARRLLAMWHIFHIPLSAGLFTLTVIHIIAALYYTLLQH
jgi:hypothetical protein